MTCFGRASRMMDLLGVALVTMMLFMLWVQNSALAADADAQIAPDAVGAAVGGEGMPGSVVSAGAEHL